MSTTQLVDFRADRISQGDVFRNVDFLESLEEQPTRFVINRIRFPLIVVLSQDCDLESDSRLREVTESAHQDQILISVLVAPAYNADDFFTGEHLSKLHIKSLAQSSDLKKKIKSNQNQRYHYLDFRDRQLVPAVIDFKHFFTLPVEVLRGTQPKNCVCRIAEMFREHLSQRFANYLSRIGLPADPPAVTKARPSEWFFPKVRT